MGNPVPTNYLYTNVKLLLERVAPVMIDGAAVIALVKYMDEAVRAKLFDEAFELADDLPNAIECGMKLLLVSCYSICVIQYCYAKFWMWNEASADQLLFWLLLFLGKDFISVIISRDDYQYPDIGFEIWYPEINTNSAYNLVLFCIKL